jgi:hypothetical protein
MDVSSKVENLNTRPIYALFKENSIGGQKIPKRRPALIAGSFKH